MNKKALREAIEQGIEYFDARNFEQAYETWQETWFETGGDEADLLQGLLMVAAGFAKLEGENHRGMEKLFQNADAILSKYEGEDYGLDIAALLQSMKSMLAHTKLNM